MFGRKKYPDFVTDENGKRPTAASPLTGDRAGSWIVGSPQAMSIVAPDGEREMYQWVDFEHGTWDDETDTLHLDFIDPALEPLNLTVEREGDPLIITMVRERVDRSIVYQQFVDLPSGATARGQVRRDGHEQLFTQVILNDIPGPDDEPVLHALEEELRSAVGLPQS